jgi:transmembrane sensor
MNEPQHPPLPPQTLASQANAWVVRLTSGQATVEDARALRAWCETSPAHTEAYRAAAQLWKQTGKAATLAAPQRSKKPRFVLGSALAACVALVVVGLAQLGAVPDARALLADHHTAQGARQRIELADGSVIEMDARTRLNVDFSASQRHITLGAGAAVFHVQHDAKRPFVVSAEGGSVTAIGTVFEVRQQGDGIKVTCSEGVVAVNQPGFAQQLLNAGQQLQYGDQGLSAQRAVDAEQELAWRQDLLVFKNRPLQELVDELNRYHQSRILITNARIGALPVSGVFHLKRPDEALRHIEQTLQLSATQLPAGVVLLR